MADTLCSTRSGHNPTTRPHTHSPTLPNPYPNPNPNSNPNPSHSPVCGEVRRSGPLADPAPDAPPPIAHAENSTAHRNHNHHHHHRRHASAAAASSSQVAGNFIGWLAVHSHLTEVNHLEPRRRLESDHQSAIAASDNNSIRISSMTNSPPLPLGHQISYC